MFDRQSDPRLATALDGSAELTTFRADIAKGMSDVQAGRVTAADMASIKAAGRVILETQCTSEFRGVFLKDV